MLSEHLQPLTTQLTLGLSLKDEATFANFYAGKNAEILAELKKTASGQGEKVTYLSGTRGEGLSHLLQAACHYAHQHQLSSVYLPLANFLTFSPTDLVCGFESLALICLDDLQVIAGHPLWEEAIFHLYNRVYDSGGSIIIAAHDKPHAINCKLPDLISRLSWGMVYHLQPLTDEEKMLVLIMHARHRGMHLSEDVCNYILTHYPRHLGTMFTVLNKLDKASLAAKRRLTIPFVKEVLLREASNRRQHDAN